MIPRITKSSLLLIKGLSPFDFEVKTDKVEFDPDDMYMEIPKMFRGVESWLKTTNLLCWNCGGSCKSYPRFLPSDPRIENGIEVCKVTGNFCTEGCVQAYIDIYLPEHMRADASSLLCRFADKFPKSSHKTKKVIKYAPSEPKFIMKAYCGPNGLSREEYDERRDAMLNIEI